MSAETPWEELELHRVDPGEQGFTAQENETISLRNRVRALEAEVATLKRVNIAVRKQRDLARADRWRISQGKATS